MDLRAKRLSVGLACLLLAVEAHGSTDYILQRHLSVGTPSGSVHDVTLDSLQIYDHSGAGGTLLGTFSFGNFIDLTPGFCQEPGMGAAPAGAVRVCVGTNDVTTHPDPNTTAAPAPSVFKWYNAGCTGTVTIINVDGDPGGEFASHGFAQGSVFIHGAPGYESSFAFGDASGESQTFSIPAGGTADGGAVSVVLTGGSQEYAAQSGLGSAGQGAPLHYSISAPSTWHCGENITVTITWTGGPKPSITPTPSPGATPTPQPSATATATAAPPPTPVPVPTPASNPNNGYAPPAQSTPFPGASPGNVFVSNPNNFYGPVKQAMEDADLADRAPTDGGAFNINNGTHAQGNYDSRGHLDDVQGQLTDLNTKKASVVSGLSGKITTLVSDVGAISGQTFGSVSTIGMNFNAIGSAPAVGRISLPTSINLSPWMGMIGTLRAILAWLIRIAFFVLVFRLFAAQGVRT